MVKINLCNSRFYEYRVVCRAWSVFQGLQERIVWHSLNAPSCNCTLALNAPLHLELFIDFCALLSLHNQHCNAMHWHYVWQNLKLYSTPDISLHKKKKVHGQSGHLDNDTQFSKFESQIHKKQSGIHSKVGKKTVVIIITSLPTTHRDTTQAQEVIYCIAVLQWSFHWFSEYYILQRM